MALTEAFAIGQHVRVKASLGGCTSALIGREGEVVRSNYAGHIAVVLDGNRKHYFFPSELTSAEPVRPRFMTAWIHSEGFTPTGDAFMTLEAAEEFAQVTLIQNCREDQIAVFEIRSVHMARLEVTSEAA